MAVKSDGFPENSRLIESSGFTENQRWAENRRRVESFVRKIKKKRTKIPKNPRRNFFRIITD